MSLRSFVLAAAVVLLAFGAPAFAQEKAAGAVSGKFGTVDLDRVLQTAEAGKGIMADMEAKRKEYQAQISKEEDALRNFESSVMKDKDKLSADEMNKKRKEFETRMMAAQKMVQDRKRQLDEAFASSMEKLRVEALKATAEIARTKQFDAVFAQQALVLGEKELDITDEVLARVNAAVKKIPVEWTGKKKAN